MVWSRKHSMGRQSFLSKAIWCVLSGSSSASYRQTPSHHSTATQGMEAHTCDPKPRHSGWQGRSLSASSGQTWWTPCARLLQRPCLKNKTPPPKPKRKPCWEPIDLMNNERKLLGGKVASVLNMHTFCSCYNNCLDSIYTKWVETIWRIFIGQEGVWGLHANIMHAILCNGRGQSCISQVLESMPQECWGLTTESKPEQENTEFLFLKLITPIFLDVCVYVYMCAGTHVYRGMHECVPKYWGRRITLSTIPEHQLLGLELSFRLEAWLTSARAPAAPSSVLALQG